jgi:hypothetical protein
MPTFINQGLYDVVRSLYDELLTNFTGEDFSGEQFLESFPHWFTHDQPDRQQRIVKAALPSGFRKEAEDAIAACYSDHGGGDLESHVCDAVEDFLNYVIPRAAGLSDERVIFDQYYAAFDSSIYGKTCLVTVFAILQDIWDNSGSAILPPGFRLRYLWPGHGRADSAYTRERAVPFFEIRKDAYPIGKGREIGSLNSYFVLEYTKAIPKNPNTIGTAYILRDEVARKFIFASRITMYSTAHSDYRCFRLLGHLSTNSMNLMNFPDDRIDGG